MGRLGVILKFTLTKKGLNALKKILISLRTVLLTVLLLTMTSGEVQAKTAPYLYPLPAPIIDVFPDEGLATDMAKNLKKESINDVINQDDLDELISLGFETESITNESIKLLERALFNNVTSISLMEFGDGLTEFPDITTIPHLNTLFFNSPPDGVSRSLSLPDYQNYPEMNAITMPGHTLIGSIPDFTGMPVLKSLDISHMGITSDEVPDFQNIPKLTTLDLSFNNLTNTMVNFTNLPHLSRLNLDFNYLNELPSNVLSSIFVQNQEGTVPDQTISQGETCTIELPIYFQMAEIDMLVNPTVTGAYVTDNVNYVPITANVATESFTLDTSKLSPGVYKFNVQFNKAYPVTQEGCVYDWELTIN